MAIHALRLASPYAVGVAPAGSGGVIAGWNHRLPLSNAELTLLWIRFPFRNAR